MSDFNTENQVVPVCPWCGSELDAGELELDVSEATVEDYHLSTDILCPECNRPFEVTATFVYSTYKSDIEADELINGNMGRDLYDTEIDIDGFIG